MSCKRSNQNGTEIQFHWSCSIVEHESASIVWNSLTDVRITRYYPRTISFFFYVKCTSWLDFIFLSGPSSQLNGTLFQIYSITGIHSSCCSNLIYFCTYWKIIVLLLSSVRFKKFTVMNAISLWAALSKSYRFIQFRWYVHIKWIYCWNLRFICLKTVRKIVVILQHDIQS